MMKEAVYGEQIIDIQCWGAQQSYITGNKEVLPWPIPILYVLEVRED
jgi:hypothetical protein